jgi:hypothetical protein
MDGEIQNEKSEGFGNDLAKKVLAATRAEIEKRVMGLNCPVHGDKPRWKSVKTTGTEADLEFDCCCQELARMIEKALK